MDYKTIFGLWYADSTLRGMDPIARFIRHAYTLIIAPLAILAVLAFLTDTNYFYMLAVCLKGIWYFWVKTIWYLITHFDKVVWIVRNMISPGCCGDDPGF